MTVETKGTLEESPKNALEVGNCAEVEWWQLHWADSRSKENLVNFVLYLPRKSALTPAGTTWTGFSQSGSFMGQGEWDRKRGHDLFYHSLFSPGSHVKDQCHLPGWAQRLKWQKRGALLGNFYWSQNLEWQALVDEKVGCLHGQHFKILVLQKYSGSPLSLVLFP